MSDVPDPQNLFETVDADSALPPSDKRIVFGARKPTEEALPLTGIPLIIEAPFPYERTLQWLPVALWEEKKADSKKSQADEETVLSTDSSEDPEAGSTANHESANVPFALTGDGNTAVVVSQEVLIKVNEHVSQSLDHEMGGFLLGNRYRCPTTACDYVIIDQYSRARFTEATEVRLAFTHEAWAQLSDELSGKFLGKLLIGWYHSHPRMDVFLSSHDMEIQTERFSEPWMVALVLEPEKHLGGFFCARDGRVKPNAPVDFFELLERNSRDSVIAWENYKALDPATSATPVLSATNTATSSNTTLQEPLPVRTKPGQKVPVKNRRRRRFLFLAFVVLTVLGAATAAVMKRQQLRTWLQNRTAGVAPPPPAQPAPVVVQPTPEQQPTTVPTPEASPAAQVSPAPQASPAASETVPAEQPSPQPEAPADPVTLQPKRTSGRAGTPTTSRRQPRVTSRRRDRKPS